MKRSFDGLLGDLDLADRARDEPEAILELDYVGNVCTLAKITKTSVQSQERKRPESLSGLQFCLKFADQYKKNKICGHD